MTVLVATVLLLAGPAAFSQIDERVDVGIIEIWAKVTDGDNRVLDDLKPEDFTIYIDGKKMDLRCFDKTFDSISTEAGEPMPGEVSTTETEDRQKRVYIFFFDLLHSSARDMDFLKKRVVEFLDTSFGEDDSGIVFALLPSVNLGVAQKLTSSKQALMSVVGKMTGNAALEKRVRNNERELLEVLYAFGGAGVSQNTSDRGAAGSRSPEMILQARGLARTYAAQERNLSKITLNSFLAIADYLVDSPYDGRPVMIYVSGGFSLRPGRNYYEMVQRAIEDQFVRGTEDMAYWEYPPDNDFDNEVKKAIGLLNRINVTIYSIDANGLENHQAGAEVEGRLAALTPGAAPYLDELRDSLAMVSHETGGIAFLNSQNYSLGLDEITKDMGQQYWLCANLPASRKRGNYHKIEVKVARNDVEVRHRRGYVD